MNNPIINLEGVDLHQMNQQLFSNINLKINPGEFIYLIGETPQGRALRLTPSISNLHERMET